jgi:RNA-binding motif protein, X-linked 2
VSLLFKMFSVSQISKLSEHELKNKCKLENSFHFQHNGNKNIFVANIPNETSEEELIQIFSQWGEVLTCVNKGVSCWLIGYEDWRSTVLAVDNFNGMKLGDSVIKVDHGNFIRRNS